MMTLYVLVKITWKQMSHFDNELLLGELEIRINYNN